MKSGEVKENERKQKNLSMRRMTLSSIVLRNFFKTLLEGQRKGHGPYLMSGEWMRENCTSARQDKVVGMGNTAR